MPSFLNQLLGSKPTVPNLPVVDLGEQQQKAISENQAALPGAQNLVSSANLFSRSQIDQMLQATIPGFESMKSSAGANIESELKGEIPQDVSEAVQNSAAARSLGLGIGGSGGSRNLVARDLGLTSLDLTQTGLNSMENWMKTSAALYEPSMMNISSMFISPTQQAQWTNEQNVQQFQREWMQNQINAQPAMWAQAFKEAVQTAISMYSGDGSGIQHAGTIPVQGSGVGGGMGGGGGDGMIGSPTGPEGSFDVGGFGAGLDTSGSSAAGDFGAGFGGDMTGMV